MAIPVPEWEDDPINHPTHYTSHPSGVECIVITEHSNFCIGNAIKYLWRADGRGTPLADLRKAAWYVAREIERRVREEKEQAPNPVTRPVSDRTVAKLEFPQPEPREVSKEKAAEDALSHGRSRITIPGRFQ